MTSLCTIHRKTGSTVTVGDFRVDGYAPTHTDLPLRVGGANRGASGTRTESIGETDVQIATRIAHLPADTTDLRDGDLIEVTDGENAGAVLQITEATFQDQATARRVPVFEVQRPEGLG